MWQRLYADYSIFVERDLFFHLNRKMFYDNLHHWLTVQE